MGMGNPSSPCEGDGASLIVDEEEGIISDPCEDDGYSSHAIVDVVDKESL